MRAYVLAFPFLVTACLALAAGPSDLLLKTTLEARYKEMNTAMALAMPTPFPRSWPLIS